VTARVYAGERFFDLIQSHRAIAEGIDVPGRLAHALFTLTHERCLEGADIQADQRPVENRGGGFAG
jgi:hypothetical protein